MAKTAHERLAEAQKALKDAETRADDPKVPMAKRRQCRDTIRHLTGEVERLEREAREAPAPPDPVAPEYRIIARACVAFGMF